jgi:hypothetical protein
MKLGARRGLVGSGKSLARLIAFLQSVHAFPAWQLTGVLQTFFAAGMANLGAQSGVFGSEIRALRKKARGE